jgi:hypothetical protein
MFPIAPPTDGTLERLGSVLVITIALALALVPLAS